MQKSTRLFFIVVLFPFVLSSQVSSSSNQDLVLDPAKVAKYEPYVVLRHAAYEPGGYAAWKADNPGVYFKEMWYWTESFYIKRDHLTQGIVMDEAMIDVSRFERQRSDTAEVIVTFPGYKDAMVLLPRQQLLYKPSK
jgi:hypothetical protein